MKTNCQIDSKQKLRHNLKRIKTQCLILRKDLKEVKTCHQKLRNQLFQGQMDKIQKQFDIRQFNKQNNNPNRNQRFQKINSINTTTIFSRINSNSLYNIINQQKSYSNSINISKINQTQECKQYTKNKIENQKLKDKIMEELLQLKLIEKRENIIRQTNERMKTYYSESKKKIQEKENKQKIIQCVDKTKPFIGFNSQDQLQLSKIHHKNQRFTTSGLSFLTDSSLCDKQNKKDFINHCESECNSKSFIESQVSIPISINFKQQKTLCCVNSHQYYNGFVKQNTQIPNGKGYLVFCCEKMPYWSNKLNFYNGNFKMGKFDGFGTLGYKGKEQVKYVGDFKDGHREGHGSLYCNGKAQVGTWKNNEYIF